MVILYDVNRGKKDINEILSEEIMEINRKTSRYTIFEVMNVSEAFRQITIRIKGILEKRYDTNNER